MLSGRTIPCLRAPQWIDLKYWRKSELAELSPQRIPHNEWNRSFSPQTFQLSG